MYVFRTSITHHQGVLEVAQSEHPVHWCLDVEPPETLQGGIYSYNHHGLYSPRWALVSSSKCRQWPLPLAAASQFLLSCFLASSSTSTIHVDFVRPSPRWLPGFVYNIFSGNSFSSIRKIWSTHLTLLDFITRVAQKVMPHIFFSRKLFIQNVWNSRTV